MVSRNFVPVAVNRLLLKDNPTRDGQLFRDMYAKANTYQGIWLFAPDLTLLAKHHDIRDHNRWADEVYQAADDALNLFGEVSTRTAVAIDYYSYVGRGMARDGGVSLAVFVRPFPREVIISPPVVDEISLSSEEMTQLFAGKSLGSTRWTVPDGIARKLSRALSPVSDLSTMFRPEEVTEVFLTAELEQGKGKADDVVARYTGKISAKRFYNNLPVSAEMKIEGVAKGKTGRNLPLFFSLILSGTYRHYPPDDAPRKVYALVEWRM